MFMGDAVSVGIRKLLTKEIHAEVYLPSKSHSHARPMALWIYLGMSMTNMSQEEARDPAYHRGLGRGSKAQARRKLPRVQHQQENVKLS
jgi:hypothetical protein